MTEKHGGEYTPSAEEVRRHWGLAVDTHRREERLAEFDRMIAKVRAEAKAEAWDACEGAWYHAHSLDNIEPWGYLPHNPYKETE